MITIKGKIIFSSGAPAPLPDGSVLTVKFSDTSLADAASKTLGKSVQSINGYVQGQDLCFEVESAQTAVCDYGSTMSAVLNVGWSPSGDEWVRKGDYLNDTSHHVNTKEGNNRDSDIISEGLFFMDKNHHLLLGCTGSVASIKLPKLVLQLKSQYKKLEIKLVLTKNADFFLSEDDTKFLMEHKVEILRDVDEWKYWKKVGDGIVHIDLVKWADSLLLAPLDANTMSKLANGICDNLLTCVCRAWDFRKPLFCAPAMNTKMWDHPITEIHVSTLKLWGYELINPIKKSLACGDVGIGAMAEVEQIISVIDKHLATYS